MARPGLLGRINSLLQNDYATYKLIKLFFYQNSSSYYKYDSRFYAGDDIFFQLSMIYLHKCDEACKMAGG